MKAFLLAAGLGERMQPYTHLVPKALIPVQGRPLIDHHILALAAAGFESVVINVFHLADQIRAHVGDGSRYGIPVVYSDETQTGLLGVYGGVHHALALLGDAPFLLLSVDIHTDFPLQTLLDQQPGHVHCVMVPNPAWHPQGDFWVDEANGLLLAAASRAEGCAQSPQAACYTYGNLGVFQPAFFAASPTEVPSFGGKIADVIPMHDVTAEIYRGVWHNVGTAAQWRAVASADDALPVVE